MPRKASTRSCPRSRSVATLTERVAVLEERSAASAAERAEILDALSKITETLATHTAALNRFRGFTGAVLLMGSAIAAGWAFVKSLLPSLSQFFAR